MVAESDMKRFLRDERGATAMEYALIAGLISILLITGATSIGTSMNGMYGQVVTALTSAR